MKLFSGVILSRAKLVGGKKRVIVQATMLACESIDGNL